jgi:hypothetical protein
MTERKCAIWGTPSKVEPASGDFEVHTSPRAGGKYKMSGTAKGVIENGWFQDNEFKTKLTTWLVDQRLSGIECPYVGFNPPVIKDVAHFFHEIKARKFLKTSERADRFFKRLYEINYRLGDFFLDVGRSLEADPAGQYDEWYTDRDEKRYFEAYIEALDDYDIYRVVNYLIAIKLIARGSDPYSDGIFHSLTPDGHAKLEGSAANIDSKQAFVAMWFDASLNDAYDQGIEPAIREAGYDPRIIRNKEHNNKIDDEIIAEIRRSKFVIADFTCGFSKDGKEAIARGGVYYEAGFAQGLNLPVIWTCRENVLSHVHFDTRQYNHIVWSDPEDLRVKLLNRIRATIT